MATAQLMNQLTSMSAADLKEIQARTSALLGTHSTSVTADEQMVYAAMIRILKSRGQTGLPPLQLAKTMKGTKRGIKDGVPLLIQYVNEHLEASRRIDRINGIQMLLEMLVRHLDRDGMPVNIRTLCNAVLNVSEVVDDQFPGYAESGFLPKLLKKICLATSV